MPCPGSIALSKTQAARRPAVSRKRPAKARRRKQQLDRIQAERDAKAEARERDVTCRWPGCDCQRSWGWAQGALWMRQLEVAHVKDKSLGGANERRNLILICGWRHRGNFSLHSKRARVVPIDPARGTDHLCEFWVQRQKNGAWEFVGLG
jgi:5-methylcytosine-specific restriction endonuclease McrA